MWAPFGAIPEAIKISKESLIQYGRIHKKFLKKHIVDEYFEVFTILRNRNSKKDKDLIKELIEQNIEILLNERIFQKDGKYIVMNSK